MKSIAQILSYVFHPLFIPMYLGIILLRNQYSWEHSLQMAGIFFLPILIFTVLYMFLLKRIGVISSFKMPDRKERKIPLMFIFIIFGYIGYELMHQQIQNNHFAAIFMISSLSMFIAYLLNFWFKVSLHSIGIAACTAFLYMLIPQFGISYFIISLLIMGILGSARLSLSAHSPMEVFVGYLAGWNVSVATMMVVV